MSRRDELLAKCLDYRKKIEDFSKLPSSSTREIALETLQKELLQTARQLEYLDLYP